MLMRTKRGFLHIIGYLNYTKKTYKARFNAISSSCTTTELSKLLTSCLTTIKKHVIKYCEKVYERSGKNLFWSIKNLCEVINKLKSRGFRAASLSTYDFSRLYTTLPHNLIKDKLVDLIERIFQREGSLHIACNDRHAFFTSDAVKHYNLWSCQKVCEALTFLLDNTYIRFGSRKDPWRVVILWLFTLYINIKIGKIVVKC